MNATACNALRTVSATKDTFTFDAFHWAVGVSVPTSRIEELLDELCEAGEIYEWREKVYRIKLLRM